MILQRMRVAIALLCLLAWPAYAQKTPAQIRTDINTLFPDNDQNRITPFDLRFVTTEITSAYLPVTSVIPSANIPPATNGGLGGVFAVACASNLWIQTITTGTGSPVCTQINFTNLAGTASATQIAASPASHATPIDVAGTPTWSVVPNCLDSLGQHINYAQSGDAWSCGTSTNAGPGVGSADNLLPNVQWQLWSGVTWIQEQNAAGTAAETSLSCASFATATQGPSFSCGNTQQLRTNDLIVVNNIVPFWGFTGAGYITCAQVQCTNGLVTAARVINIVANTSVSVQTPGFGGVSPVASAAATLSPIMPGEGGGGGTNGADGWIKSGTLVATVDTWGASATPASTAYPGCERPLLLRKGITGQEIYEWNVPPQALAKFRGQTITFGAAIYQRIQGGASTFNLHIDDGIGSAASATGTGASFGGYQFLSVTRAVAQNASALAIYFNLLGNSGDVFDICLPTAAFLPSIVQSQLHQNSYELIKANSHWNPPLTTPYIINFPSSNIGCPGLFGYNSNDIEAMSFGTIHNSVQFVWGDVEWTTNSVTTPINPSTMFFGGFVNCTTGALTFGLKASTIVNGTTFSTSGTRIPLYHDGTVAMYTGVSGLIPTNGTFDFWDVEVNAGNQLQ